MITKFDGYTPGPWEAGHGTFDGGYIGVFLTRASNEPRTICRVAMDGKEDEQDIPNASLIAAAPDLLARLKAMYEWMKKREWSESETGSVPGIAFRCLDKPCCPDCGAPKSNGHKAECSSGSELRLTEQLLGIKAK